MIFFPPFIVICYASSNVVCMFISKPGSIYHSLLSPNLSHLALSQHHDVLDRIWQVLVLPSDNIKLLLRLFIYSLNLKELSWIASAFNMSLVKFCLQGINLILPFNDNFVKVLSFLFHLKASRLSVIQHTAPVLFKTEVHFLHPQGQSPDMLLKF